jgi:hypothetical protein
MILSIPDPGCNLVDALSPLIQSIVSHLLDYLGLYLVYALRDTFEIFGDQMDKDRQRIFYSDLLSALMRVHLGDPVSLIASLIEFPYLCSGNLLSEEELTSLFILLLHHITPTEDIFIDQMVRQILCRFIPHNLIHTQVILLRPL